MNKIEAYPLCWPAGRPRTVARDASRFGSWSYHNDGFGNYSVRNSLTNGRARDAVYRELNRLGAKDVIFSTNMPIRQDGMFYATAKEPSDPGVAVYFTLRKRAMVFACDSWKTVKENAWAIAKTIEALRGIERWGSGDMLERAFTGFQALPSESDWRDVLGLKHKGSISRADLKLARDRAAMQAHPDRGGSHERMAQINRAYEEGSRACTS